MYIRSLALLCVFSLLAYANAAHAAESYDNCTGFIISLPAVITGQGTWCMKQDLATAVTSGSAITINTNNATIDCNDFKLGGLAAGTGTSTNGIFADSHTNLTVRHCNIRGFKIGVNFSDASGGGGHVVEDNRFDGNTYEATYVSGDGSVIRRNRVSDTGGSTTLSHSAIAIASLDNVDILDNTVSGVAATSGSGATAWGIFAENNPGGRIIGNGISGLVHDSSGNIVGIQSNYPAHIVMRDNDVAGDGSPISYALICNGSGGTVKDNVTTGFSTAILNCSDGGGNYNNP